MLLSSNKFFNKTTEHEERDIVNYVLVDLGFGYISLKFKGGDGLLSGFLNEEFFDSNEIIEAVVEFTEKLSKHSNGAYIPHNIYPNQIGNRIIRQRYFLSKRCEK